MELLPQVEKKNLNGKKSMLSPDFGANTQSAKRVLKVCPSKEQEMVVVRSGGGCEGNVLFFNKMT